MHRSTRSLFSYATLGIALALACAPEEIAVPDDGDDDNDNGGSGTGATSAQGGTVTGGTFSGGTFSGGSFSGGTPATGGAFAGGTSGTGAGGVSGTPATGGAFTGGTPATGGASGTPATGGTAGAGISGAAGTPAGGGTGSTVACDTAFVAAADGFVRAPAAAGGCWHGYAYSGSDTGSVLSTMTSFAMCATAPAPCTLRVAGMLGAATAANSYAGVVYLGFNVNQAAGSTTFGTLAPAGTNLVVTYTKVSGPATVRVQIQAGANRWCANLTASPAAIPYTMFNTTCWEPTTGVAYAKQPIEAVQLVAPGEATAVPIDMTLVSVQDM